MSNSPKNRQDRQGLLESTTNNKMAMVETTTNSFSNTHYTHYNDHLQNTNRSWQSNRHNLD
jgi:hypothetical protein